MASKNEQSMAPCSRFPMTYKTPGLTLWTPCSIVEPWTQTHFLLAWWVPVEMFMAPWAPCWDCWTTMLHMFTLTLSTTEWTSMCACCVLKAVVGKLESTNFSQLSSFLPWIFTKETLCWMVVSCEVVKVFWHPPTVRTSNQQPHGLQCLQVPYISSLPSINLSEPHLPRWRASVQNQKDQQTVTNKFRSNSSSKSVTIKLQSRKRYPVY